MGTAKKKKSSPQTTGEVVEEYQHSLEKQGCSAKTVNIYSKAVTQFYSLYNELNIENLKAYRAYLIQNYQTSTVNTRICGINRFLDFLFSCGQIPQCLLLGSVPYPSDSSNIIQFSDMEKYFSRSRTNGIYKVLPVKEQKKTYMDNVISQKDYEKLKRKLKQDGNMYWYFVVRFLGATGARVSELLQIKIEDLKLGYLDLYSKGGKIRRLYFPKVLCEEALPYFLGRGIDSGFLFLNRQGQLITARGIELQLKTLARRYHINPDTVYPHSFRHRYAKNFLKRFNDISLLADLMGHDSIETTRIYLTRSSQEQKELLDRIIVW